MLWLLAMEVSFASICRWPSVGEAALSIQYFSFESFSIFVQASHQLSGPAAAD
jgi:hypothetical protein